MVAAKRHKSFTPKNRKKSTPLTFELYDETFEAFPDLQGAVILDFAASMSTSNSKIDEDEDGVGGAEAANLIVTFFEKALLPDSLQRFNKLIRDPDTIVEAELLAEIVGWLMEQYTSRDLAVSSVSSASS
jgi:hypothetical protein